MQAFLYAFLQDFFQRCDEGFKTGFVFFREAANGRTVDVQHTPDLAAHMDGNHDLRIGGAVAGDVARELMDIVNQLGAVFRDCRAADTAAYWKG